VAAAVLPAQRQATRRSQLLTDRSRISISVSSECELAQHPVTCTDAPTCGGGRRVIVPSGECITVPCMGTRVGLMFTKTNAAAAV
jgi:hypothetical protein